MVYGPIAAALGELFIGNGWLGGLLPATVFAMNAQSGSIFYGLWYPIVIAGATVVIGTVVPARNQGSRHLHAWR